jgi:hypothetical protein
MGVPHTMSTHILKDIEVSDLQGGNSIKIPKVYKKDRMPVTRDHVPTQDDISKWQHLKEIKLPEINAEVEPLIGNAVADAYTPLKVVTGPRGTPYATHTLLGWVVWNVVRNGTESTMNLPVNRAEIGKVCHRHGLSGTCD